MKKTTRTPASNDPADTALPQVERLIAGEHHDPHSILGVHPFENKERITIRAFHPDAVEADLSIDSGAHKPMKKIHPGGLFSVHMTNDTWPVNYRVKFIFDNGDEWERMDPYRFLPTLGELDQYLAGEGTHQRLYERLGAHPRAIDDVEGVSFAVWAPNARRVSVIGDFNRWDGRIYPIRCLGTTAICELFVPGLTSGELYKLVIKIRDGNFRT